MRNRASEPTGIEMRDKGFKDRCAVFCSASVWRRIILKASALDDLILWFPNAQTLKARLTCETGTSLPNAFSMAEQP